MPTDPGAGDRMGGDRATSGMMQAMRTVMPASPAATARRARAGAGLK
jgi:hypothetical protein